MNNLIKVFLMLLLVFSGDISSLASPIGDHPKSISFHLVRVADEMDFVNALFSLNGEYEIRFVTVK